eukprot:TRINITY_DN3904_c0_g1_i1.p1 TRINITY_DN3904_c0_g1~~TRINITY_DN3904_c0_g1_i1.p1  ORF type:complete len:158 (-),score=11.06 TRINITY_DN3904_c0_g1_i1:506-979(-)
MPLHMKSFQLFAICFLLVFLLTLFNEKNAVVSGLVASIAIFGTFITYKQQKVKANEIKHVLQQLADELKSEKENSEQYHKLLNETQTSLERNRAKYGELLDKLASTKTEGRLVAQSWEARFNAIKGENESLQTENTKLEKQFDDSQFLFADSAFTKR